MSKPKRATLTRRRVATTPFPLTLRSGSSSLTIAPARVLVVFRARPSKTGLVTALAGYKLVLDDGGDGHAPPPPGLPITRTPQWVFARTRDGQAISQSTIAALQADRALTMVAPVYHRDDIEGARGLVAVLPRGFAIRLDVRERPDVGRIFQLLRLSVHEQRTRFLRPYTFLSTSDFVENAAHFAAPRLAQALAQLAPEIVHEILPLVSGMSAVDPSDSFYTTVPAGDAEQANKQWDMKRVGARYAWQNNVGITGVSGFIIDEGIQQNHADFAQAVAAGRLSQHNVDTGGVDAATFAPNSDHGTALAGIMTAGHDDGGQSTAGHASGATLVSLRGGSGGTIDPLTNAIIAAALNSAGTSGVPSVACIGIAAGDVRFIDPMVQSALTANPDLLVCVASGNFTASADQLINYTSGGGAYHPNLMICGATQQGTAVPNVPTANTGDDVWKDLGGAGDPGSRHGPEISVVAPGDALVTMTTPVGYAIGTLRLGTSFAAAHVAGLALLVRSKEGAAFNAASVRHKIERTSAKTYTQRYATTTTGATAITIGLFNEFMGYGRVDASAVLVHDVDVDAGDLGRADVYIRSYPTDGGARPIPGGQDFWSSGDVVISTDIALIPVGPTTSGSAADNAFTAARNAVTSNNIPAPGGITAVPVYVYVRVVNIGPGAARGIKVTAVTGACATGWVYPDNWDSATDAIHVAAVNDGGTEYFSGPLAAGAVYIARLLIPTGSNYTGFSMNHACCLTRVTSSSDIAFSRVMYMGSGAQPQFNNIMQRNLNIV